MDIRQRLIGIFICLPLLLSARGLADCVDLVKGPIVYDVRSCKQVSTSDFRRDANLGFIKDLTERQRREFYLKYRGMLVSGKVVRSNAIQYGLSKQKGALAGKVVKMFLPGTSKCNVVDNKRLAGSLNEACCDGSGDAPCLLSSAYVFTKVKVLGEANSNVGDKERATAALSAYYKKGRKLYREKKYKKAAAELQAAADRGELDVPGRFLLGLSYRKLDRCHKALPVLKEIFDKKENKKTWADQESFVRRANFLLARCYAMTSKPGEASMILNSYLIEPKRYESELRESLKHADFGWIHASKEYRDYRKEARKVLRNLK